MTIDRFENDYFFLSNFYPAKVVMDGMTFQSTEAAFQAAKCKDISGRRDFVPLNPSQAKRKGRHVELRADWEFVKVDVMRQLLLTKFTMNPSLGRKLLETGDATLVEGNDWGDRFWGVDGTGRNVLGRLLMETRDYLKLLQWKPEADAANGGVV